MSRHEQATAYFLWNLLRNIGAIERTSYAATAAFTLDYLAFMHGEA